MQRRLFFLNKLMRKIQERFARDYCDREGQQQSPEHL